ncbi:MAG: hypothetical protein LIO72_03010, partial [Ruminococcus sp.]|nr:hypothetical protein [Ruminococcus sp.]
FKIIDPTVIDIDRKQLQEAYLWTDEMLEMLDECNRLVQENTIMYYTGDLGSGLDSTFSSLDWGINRSGASYSWAQLKETYGDRLEYYIDELNAQIDAYLDTGELVS